MPGNRRGGSIDAPHVDERPKVGTTVVVLPDTDLDAVLTGARRTIELFVTAEHGSVEERVELVAGLELMADAIQMLARRVAELERRDARASVDVEQLRRSPS